MPAIVTNKFRIHNAEQFTEAFDETDDTIVYFFIGGTSPFADDSAPPTPTDDVNNTEYEHWRDMFAAKRIQPSDVSHVIPRVDWTSGTTYAEYDHEDADLFTRNFYVMTDEFNVYKCLFNNNGGQSSSKPTGTSDAAITTSDGYQWKFMYTVSASQALKFVTSSHIPVQTLSADDGSAQWSVQTAAVNGSLDIVDVTSGGTGYNTGTTTVAISGDGTGATAEAVVTGGVVTKINVTNSGSGYSRATITIGGDGAGATASAYISPRGGHGANAIEELGGFFVMLNARLDADESGTFSTGNDFRKIGLVRDPYLLGTTTRATTASVRQTIRLTIPDASGAFSVDETVTTTAGDTASVVEWDAANNYLYINQETGTFSSTEVVTGGTSGSNGTISAINDRGLEPYSGDIIYIENRRPIQRSDDQIEDVKLVIEF